MKIPYGRRARIGLIVPSLNVVMEPEITALLPADVSLHATRIPLTSGSPAALDEMTEGVFRAAELLAHASVSIIIFGCTTGSMMKGIAWDRELAETIERQTRIPTVTTAGAVVAALRELGVRRVAVATPYPDEVNEGVRRFLQDAGFEVTQIATILHDGWNVLESESAFCSLAKRIDSPEAECLLISCTNAQALGTLAKLERDLGKPVVSSNAATMWATLRRLGLVAGKQDCGELLSRL